MASLRSLHPQCHTREGALAFPFIFRPLLMRRPESGMLDGGLITEALHWTVCRDTGG